MKALMWGLVDQGARTYLVIMYGGEYPEPFRFLAYLFDSDYQLFNAPVSEWFYDPEDREYWDKAYHVKFACRIVFAMMIDVIGREILDLYWLRGKIVKRGQLKEMYFSRRGIPVLGAYHFHLLLPKRTMVGLPEHYTRKPV